MLARMCFGLAVAAMAQVMAGCETTYFNQNCPQLSIAYSAAQGGSRLPRTGLNKGLPCKGGLAITALPRCLATGNRRCST